MNAFTIRDLENLSGVKAHTIRIWEQRYHFLKPQRTSTNIRYYSNEELKTILNIALLNKYGFRISHIDRMGPDEIREKILSLTDVRAIQERIINELVQAMVDMDVMQFEKVLNDHIRQKGIERTVTQIIFPFLEKTGVLWITGHVNPAQEHLVTNMIRQKLIVAIESTMPATRINKSFLLFLPEGEYHELGLLYMYYLLKSRGARTIYLGANVPMRDVEYVVKNMRPDILFVHLSSTAPGFNFDKFLSQAEQRFGNTPTVISGPITHAYLKKLPGQVAFKKSLQEVIEFLNSF